MQDTNLNLSKTIESVEKNSESLTSGFENIGKFYKHLRKESKKLKLKSIDKEIYMIMVEYSFGYMKNINLELQISVNQLMEETRSSNKTIIESMKRLLDSELISRVKWQHTGPKQVYRYKVKFPKDYNIDYKQVETKEDVDVRKENEFRECL